MASNKKPNGPTGKSSAPVRSQKAKKNDYVKKQTTTFVNVNPKKLERRFLVNSESKFSGSKSFGLRNTKADLWEFTCKELLTTVAVGDSPFQAGISLSPVGNASFQKLSEISPLFEQYRIKHLELVYTPGCNTSTAGQICLAIDYDASDNAPANFLELSQWQSCKYGSVISELRLPYINKEKALTWYFSSSDTPSVSVSRMQMPGIIYLRTDNGMYDNSVFAGYLHAHYTYEFTGMRAPQLGSMFTFNPVDMPSGCNVGIDQTMSTSDIMNQSYIHFVPINQKYGGVTTRNLIGSNSNGFANATLQSIHTGRPLIDNFMLPSMGENGVLNYPGTSVYWRIDPGVMLTLPVNKYMNFSFRGVNNAAIASLSGHLLREEPEEKKEKLAVIKKSLVFEDDSPIVSVRQVSASEWVAVHADGSLTPIYPEGDSRNKKSVGATALNNIDIKILVWNNSTGTLTSLLDVLNITPGSAFSNGLLIQATAPNQFLCVKAVSGTNVRSWGNCCISYQSVGAMD